MAPKRSKKAEDRSGQKVKDEPSTDDETSNDNNDQPSLLDSRGMAGIDALLEAAGLKSLAAGAAVARAIQTEIEDNLKDVAEAKGGYINLSQVPNGARNGRWEWLNRKLDQILANALVHKMGGATALDTTIARENGVFDQEPIVPSELQPSTVYYPNPRYLNPETRPGRRGQFRFLSEGPGSAQDLARINLGGQTGFEGNANPTAEEIWAYRRHVQARVDRGEDIIDLSDGVDLVWCPDQDATPSPSPSPSDVSLVSNIDPLSESKHQPTNPQHPGHDQTHTGRLSTAHYQTRRIKGMLYTVDRSRAHAGDKEPHKLEIVNKNGLWRKYHHTVNWDDKASVERLNKWREQEFKRGGWPNKRQDVRTPYTKEQKTWLNDTYVKPFGGDRPEGSSMQDVTQAFNDRYPSDPRNESGITALIDRLRDKLKKNLKRRSHPTGSNSGSESSDEEE